MNYKNFFNLISFNYLVPITAILAILVDRVTKLYLPVTKYYNQGAAFGILNGQTGFLAAFSAIVLIALIIYVIKTNSRLTPLQKLGIGLLIGGTAGNLFDRVCYGYVVDFINLTFIDFPVFNMADVFINIGAVFMVLPVIKKD